MVLLLVLLVLFVAVRRCCRLSVIVFEAQLLGTALSKDTLTGAEVLSVRLALVEAAELSNRAKGVALGTQCGIELTDIGFV